MKVVTLLVLGMLLCTRQVSSLYNCGLRYDVRAYQAWYDFGAYLVFGMYDIPPESFDDCKLCDDFGNKMAKLHYAVMDMED